ncbi:hypothetical protein [Herbaspirillum frisingense]|uniref:Ribbon-helix-helix protein, CopG family n=1 Tax=Herbaspirillum frisingense TaxID=92645 RepID=A0ABU1PBX7_9BURK|nr:hypothetical protein [Herbaspirillum frisingense]MDR6583430.1 hypothetical protein [Herbaspirillum frisingense]
MSDKVPSLLSDVYNQLSHMPTLSKPVCRPHTDTSVAVTFRLEIDEEQRLAELARQDLRTRSSFVRLLILRGMAAYDNDVKAGRA